MNETPSAVASSPLTESPVPSARTPRAMNGIDQSALKPLGDTLRLVGKNPPSNPGLGQSPCNDSCVQLQICLEHRDLEERAAPFFSDGLDDGRSSRRKHQVHALLCNMTLRLRRNSVGNRKSRSKEGLLAAHMAAYLSDDIGRHFCPVIN